MYLFGVFVACLLVSQGSAGDIDDGFRGFLQTGESEVYSSAAGTVQLIPGVEVVKNVEEKSATPPCAKYVKLLLEKLLQQLSNMDFDDTKPDSDPSLEYVPGVPEIQTVPEVDSVVIENPKAQCAKCFGKVTEVLNLAKQHIIFKHLMRARNIKL